MLALDLAAVGDSSFVIGLLLGVALAGGSIWSLGIARIERTFGRRFSFGLACSLLAAGGFLLWAGTDEPAAVLVALLLGGVVAGSSDVAPLGVLEQAALGDATVADSRTSSFALYNLLGYLGAAVGALLAGLLVGGGSTGSVGVSGGAHDATLLFYGALGVALLPVYRRLSPGPGPSRGKRRPPALSPSSRKRIFPLATLFAVDAFGGGLIINSLVVYYLSLRFHAAGPELGLLFFLGNAASAISLLVAPVIARRIGLVRTMVFTHIPSSLLLVAFAFSPTLLVASALWVARSTLSQMDVPTRQSYTLAIVEPHERATAVGYTTAARSGQAFGGPVTGGFLSAGGPWVAAPFVFAGAIKLAYDLVLFARFRRVRPPEELRTDPA